MNTRYHLYLVVLMICLVCTEGNSRAVEGIVAGEPLVAEVFNDHMVLQRDQPVNIWGTADAFQPVEVFFISQVFKTTADDSGRWKVSLPAMKMGGPYSMEIAAGETTIKLEDVFVGDVWLASGQSNMAFRLKSADDPDKESLFADVENYNIRTYEVAKLVSGGKLLDKPDEPWARANRDNMDEWSAVAYYFARGLYKHLKVPIGIINCSQGASTVGAWMSPASLEASEVSLKTYDGIERYYRNPGVLYKAMLAKIIPYTLKGVIWYQGEANTQEPDAYKELFSQLINQWRTEWGQHDLPFLFAQLPGFARKEDKTGMSWALFRRAQESVSSSIPNCGMVVLIDAGEKDDIHPKNKKVVGERLVLAARAVAYNEPVDFSGPVLDRITYKGNSAIVSYRHAEEGLILKGKALLGFAVCDNAGNWSPARAKLKGKGVRLSHAEGKEITGVRYAWENAPDVNLYDRNDLPAAPFLTQKE